MEKTPKKGFLYDFLFSCNASFPKVIQTTPSKEENRANADVGNYNNPPFTENLIAT
jgi:hypothetical protein